jgi:hypothetical protein
VRSVTGETGKNPNGGGDHRSSARVPERTRRRPVDPEDHETTYRFVTEDGVYFCESCDTQVSPADATCPACGYALRVRATDEERDGEENEDEGEHETRNEDETTELTTSKSSSPRNE